MRTVYFLILAGLLSPALAYAGPLPPIAFLSMGFHEAELPDFARSQWQQVRQKQRDAYLSITADLNADGKPDEARVLLNPLANEARIVVVTTTAQKIDTYVFETVTLDQADMIGIELAPRMPGGSSVPAVAIFNFQTGERHTYAFDGDEFRKDVSRAKPAPSVGT